jgi:uncharacterized protein
MRIHLETGGQSNLIRAHAPGQVTVNDTVYRESVIVLPHRLVLDWPPQRFADLTVTHLEVLTTLESEVVILGTGQRLQFPRAELLAPLIASGTGFEVMDTAAACRTYNILMGEGRKVAAALLMMEND